MLGFETTRYLALHNTTLYYFDVSFFGYSRLALVYLLEAVRYRIYMWNGYKYKQRGLFFYCLMVVNQQSFSLNRIVLYPKIGRNSPNIQYNWDFIIKLTSFNNLEKGALPRYFLI
jgi:hypothetical protein